MSTISRPSRKPVVTGDSQGARQSRAIAAAYERQAAVLLEREASRGGKPGASLAQIVSEYADADVDGGSADGGGPAA